MDRRNLKDHARPALREIFAQEGISAYRAEQVLGWLYGRGVDDLHAMTDLPAPLRESLAECWSSRALEDRETLTSEDGSKKLALEAEDGSLLEAVLIPEERRNTLCVSTQVGCPLACSFCATGKMGLKRNLRVSEIVDQLMRAKEVLSPEETISNVVFMGMGEPLLNLAAVRESIEIFTDPKAWAWRPAESRSPRRGSCPRSGPCSRSGRSTSRSPSTPRRTRCGTNWCP